MLDIKYVEYKPVNEGQIQNSDQKRIGPFGLLRVDSLTLRGWDSVLTNEGRIFQKHDPLSEAKWQYSGYLFIYLLYLILVS